MSHSIQFVTLPNTITPNEILQRVQYEVAHSGDRYGTERITFPTDKVFEDSEAAREYIRSLDNSWYQGYAVRFQAYKPKEPSSKMQELRKKRDEEVAKRRAYLDAHSIRNQKAALIGCPKCGSKLSREYLLTNNCPLCRTSLLSATVQKRLEAFDTKIEKLHQQMAAAGKANREKASIMWLVKYEYHC